MLPRSYNSLAPLAGLPPLVDRVQGFAAMTPTFTRQEFRDMARALLKAGQEQELDNLRLAELQDDFRRGQLALDDGFAQPADIYAAPIVGDSDLQQAGTVSGLDPHDSFGCLPSRHAFLWKLDAVIDGVSQQVAQRRVELLEDVAVDLGAIADDVESHLFAE